MTEDLSQPVVPQMNEPKIQEEIISVGTSSSDKPKKLKLVFAFLGIFFVLASTLGIVYFVRERQKVKTEAGACNYPDNPTHPCNGHAPGWSTCDGTGRWGCDQSCNHQDLPETWCEGTTEKNCEGGTVRETPNSPNCGFTPEPTLPPSFPCCTDGTQCRSWERCQANNPACPSGKSCCSLAGCASATQSDCCSGNCQGGTCVGPGTLECHADETGVKITNNTTQPISGNIRWFSRWCDHRNNPGCSCGGQSSTVSDKTLQPGETWSGGIVGSGPPTSCAWQSDVEFAWCHNTDSGCVSGCEAVSWACLSLAGSPAPDTRKSGERVTFTCNARSGTPVEHFEFRVSIDSGNPSSIGSAQAVTVSEEVYKGNVNYTIPRYGCYKVECRACTSRDSSRCTTWGQAQ